MHSNSKSFCCAGVEVVVVEDDVAERVLAHHVGDLFRCVDSAGERNMKFMTFSKEACNFQQSGDQRSVAVVFFGQQLVSEVFRAKDLRQDLGNAVQLIGEKRFAVLV